MRKILIFISVVILLTGCESNSVFECGDNKNVAGICIDDTKPVISGVEDIEIEQGSSFDPLQGVSAIDDFDGDITQNIIVTENVETDDFGTYFVKYEVEDDFENKAIAIRYVTVIFSTEFSGENLVDNGNFSNGFDGWGTYTPDDGFADFNVVDGELVINVISYQEGIYYAPRLQYTNIVFKEDSYYHVTFKMKSEDTRKVHIQIGELLDVSPWFEDFRPNTGDKIILVTEEYQTFEFVFLMNNPTNFNGAILFEMGAVGTSNYITTLYLDDLTVREVDVGN